VTAPAPDAGVRAARPADVDSLGQVHARAWQQAYSGLLPQGGDAAQPQALAQAWDTAVQHPPTPQHRVLVATAGPDVVGFAAVAPGGDADAVEGEDAELVVLLVDPDRQRLGHGSRLLNASADTLRDRGFQRLRAWVPETDDARSAFLTGAGFVADGAARVLDAGEGAAPVRERRWSAALTLAGTAG
jgi:GNAT superfamily N-acetyltransferase